VAAAAASLAILIAVPLLEFAKNIGFLSRIPPVVMWPLTAGFFFVCVHWLFDRYIWRLRILAKTLGLPDIAGKWTCNGTTFGSDGAIAHEWAAEVTIFQTWEKIRIYLDTGQSSSTSKIATICPETDRGYRLIYSYQNEPKIGEDLLIHLGFADMLIDKAATEASGEYYNVKGRQTRGRMIWKRA